MSSKRWQQITELFQAALELPPQEWETFLARACGKDQRLRKEVTSLLDCDREAGDFMENPVLVVQSVPDESDSD